MAGFGRLRSSSEPAVTLAPAFAPASTRRSPGFETDLTEEPEMVVVPQAAMSSAAATRSTRSLFIAIRITHGATLADGLDAALTAARSLRRGRPVQTDVRSAIWEW
jgi:hypothetical protein